MIFPLEYLDHKPLLKVGDKLIDISNGKIGTIKQIDNHCTKKYDVRYDNPGFIEYYVKWPNGNWSRHDAYEIDLGFYREVIPLTKAGEVLYGRKNKKSPQQGTEES